MENSPCQSAEEEVFHKLRKVDRFRRAAFHSTAGLAHDPTQPVAGLFARRTELANMSPMLGLLRDILHSPVLDIIQHLKRSTGMSVKELGAAMKMSYMGVKQHCVEMEKAGLLDTWRKPKGAGRPEKIYRLTSKADALFDCGGPALTLDILLTADRVYGETAAPRLLFAYFQAKTESYTAKLAKTLGVEERARLLAKLRSAEGCVSSCESDEHGHLLLVEHHRPLRELAARYEIVDELECEMIERLMGSEVRRSVEEVSGLVRVTFRIKTTTRKE